MTAMRTRRRPARAKRSLVAPPSFADFIGPQVPDPITFVIGEQWLDRRLFPKQATLIKIVFLRIDLLTPYDYEVIAEWEESFRFTGNNGITVGILDRMVYLRAHGYRWFREVLLVLGRRAGKGYVIALCMAYILWCYLAKGNPQKFYDIDRDKKLDVLIYAGKKKQATDNLYRDLANVILGGPCFAPYVNKPLGESLSVFAPNDKIRLAKLARRGIETTMDLASFSVQPREATMMSGRGGASCILGFDEFAHLVATGATRSADDIWTAATPSLDQFGKDAFIGLPSSPWQMIGQFYELWEQAQELNPDGSAVYPERFFLQLASWEIYYDWQRAHLIDLFPPDFTGDLGEYLDVDELPRLGEWTKPVQAYDEPMQRLEKSKPDVFAVERLSHWQSVIDAYLDPRKIALMFSGPVDEKGEPLKPPREMHRQGLLSWYYKGHVDPSLVNDNFAVAIAHTEPGEDGWERVVFDWLQFWDPADFPDHTIDYIQVEEELWELVKGLLVDNTTFDQHNCLVEGTRIQTDRGLIPIKDLVDPERRLLNGEEVPLDIPVQARGEVATIAAGYRKGYARTIVATTRPGYRIEGTPEHRVLVRRAKAKPWHRYPEPEWAEMGSLRIGDQLLVQRGGLGPEKNFDITAYSPDLSRWGVASTSNGRWEAYGRWEGRRVTLGRFPSAEAARSAVDTWRQSHPSISRITRFPTECGSELAELMGLLSAEGDVSRTSVRFGNKDRELLQHYCELMGSQFGGKWEYEYTDSWKGRYSYGWVRSGSRKLADFFCDLGVGGRSQEKCIPEAIFRSPADVAAAYLRGLFEGDGGIATSPRDRHVHLTTTSHQLALDVHQLLLSLGVFSTLLPGVYRYNGEVRHQWRIKIFSLDAIAYQRAVGFIGSHKQQLLQTLVDETYALGDRAGLRSKNSRRGDEQWFAITTLDESEALCYDLTVPGSENFTAGGIITHNSASMIAHLSEKIRKARLPKRMSIGLEVATAPHNLKVAESFKMALNQGWIECPYFEQADLELRFLQFKNGKVVHQDTGPVVHDDVARCMMEVTDYLLSSQIVRFLTGEKPMPITGTSIGGNRPWGLPATEQDGQVFGQLRQAAGLRRGEAGHTPGRGRPPVSYRPGYR